MRSLALAALVALAPSWGVAGTLTIKGSDTMVLLSQRWAEAFMTKHPGVVVQVTGGGSGTGIAGLVNGTTDLATSSRPMTDVEKRKVTAKTGRPVIEIVVAKDGVTFFVNARNKLSALTEEQLRAVYLGDVTNWKDLGGEPAPIVLYSRENNSGTYVFVKDNLLKGDDFAPEAQTLPGTAAVVNAVSKEKHSIGYGGEAYASGVKRLKLKVADQEIEASKATIMDGTYPLARDLYFYLAKPPTGDLKAFIDFALSEEGQAIVTKVGYFPVR